MYNENLFDQWEIFKKEVKSYFIRLGKTKSKERYQTRQSIERSIRKAHNLMEVIPSRCSQN